ncbi:LacI family transcriptional regulator [bacterium]|nr:MAG: LacI family transcriptional regulator [bacterium]
MSRNPRKNTSPRATIDDVAAEAGVSIATVSRVLNGITHKASAKTQQHVLDVVARLDYRPVHAGRALRTMRSALVALFVPDTSNMFYATIADAIASHLKDSGSSMILCNTRDEPAIQDRFLEEMESHLVNGIVLLGAVDSPGLRQAVANRLPVIFLNRRPPAGVDAPYIGVDNPLAGREVAEHFLERRWIPAGAIHGPLTSSASRGRYQSFRTQLARAGVKLEKRFVQPADLTIASGYQAAVDMLSERPYPRAIFCGNDLIAYGLYWRCCELKIRVPSELAIFGFDDNPLNEWLAPWLDTVRVPYEDYGAAVARALSLLSESPRRRIPREVILPHRLVIRR